MRSNIGKWVCLTVTVLASLSLVCAAPRPRSAALDLTLRQAVYVARKGSVIDLKSDRYVGANSTIRVRKSEAVSCQGDKCTFNLGVIAFRSEGKGALSTYGQFSGKGIGIVGNTIPFQDGETTRQHVLPVSLTVGSNTVNFTIDPNKKTAESNENNNSVEVTIIVVP
jgi:hypothetical protein